MPTIVAIEGRLSSIANSKKHRTGLLQHRLDKPILRTLLMAETMACVMRPAAEEN
jgi:hypothetical protein